MIFVTDQVQGTVTIRNISALSSGLYQCVASNAIGTSTCLLDLQVISREYIKFWNTKIFVKPGNEEFLLIVFRLFEDKIEILLVLLIIEMFYKCISILFSLSNMTSLWQNVFLLRVIRIKSVACLQVIA